MVKPALWSLLVAAAIGLAYYFIAANVWGIYAAMNPVNDALLDLFLRRGHVVAYQCSMALHDVIVNVLLALPFAAVFRRVHALRSRTHVALAATSAVIAGYMPAETLSPLLSHWSFWLGVLMAALSLPLAYALLSRIGADIRPRTGANA